MTGQSTVTGPTWIGLSGGGDGSGFMGVCLKFGQHIGNCSRPGKRLPAR
jgi:hypothetical protein